MNIKQVETSKDTLVAAEEYRYSIPRLEKIRNSTTAPLSISRFSIDALQAGIISGPCAIPKQLKMPLGEVSVNRDRGWSLDSFDSADDYAFFPEGYTKRADRQRRSTPSDARAPLDDGFARFLKQHSSPTHQRVTAGGHIVPMQPTPPPPHFNLFPDRGARKNDSSWEKETDGDKAKSKLPVSASITAHGLPASHCGNRLQTSDSCQTQKPKIYPNAQLNTGEEIFSDASRMPRPADMAYLNATDYAGLPHLFPHSNSAFDLNTQTVIPYHWPHLGLPLSGTVFDPYANMLIPSGDQTSMVPTPLVLTPPFPSVPATDQIGPDTPYGADFERLAQATFQPGFRPSWNPAMPINPGGADLFPYQNMMAGQVGASSVGAAPGNMPSQARTYTDLKVPDQPHGGVHFQDMANTALNNANRDSATRVTEFDVSAAENRFRDLDVKLQGHDRYTASHYSSLNRQTKSYYVAERMRIVEQRDMARRKWVQLHAELGRQRPGHGDVCAAAEQEEAVVPKSIRGGVSNPSTNTHFNVQAADWIPKGHNQNHALPIQPCPVVLDPAASIAMNRPVTENSSGGVQHSLTGRTHALTKNHCSVTQSTPGSISAPVSTVPGPYTRQLNSANGEELSEMEVDEWGVRRGFAPPQLAQKQSNEAIQLQNQENADRSTSGGLAQSADLTIGSQSSAYPVDKWGVRIGRAPPDLAREQSEQSEKLATMSHEQRSQMSVASLNKLPPTSANATKAVAFVESLTNKSYAAGSEHPHDAAEVANPGEGVLKFSRWKKGPGPTQADWEAVFKASQKAKGEKTNVYLVTGHFITVEGQGLAEDSPGAADENEKPEDTSKQQMETLVGETPEGTGRPSRVEIDVNRSEGTAGKPGVSILNPWAYHDENNFFRHKGPSSVALQSVTAQGMLPGVDGLAEHQGPQAMRMASNIVHEVSGSPAKRCSPPKRSLRDIWSPAQRKAHLQAVDETLLRAADKEATVNH